MEMPNATTAHDEVAANSGIQGMTTRDMVNNSAAADRGDDEGKHGPGGDAASTMAELETLTKETGIQVNTVLPERSQLFSISSVKDDDALLALTCIPGFKLFNTVCKLYTELQQAKSYGIPNEDAVLLTFLKLYHNVSFSLLGVLFGVQRTTALKIFKESLAILSAILGTAIFWPEKEEILQCMPKHFENYGKTRVILDCVEIPIQKPRDLECLVQTYSRRRGACTAKVLVGETPGGLISFVSAAYGGGVPDSVVTRASKVLEKCEPCNDSVMAAEGLLIDELCLQRGVELIRPPFLRKQEQLGRRDAQRNGSAASDCVCVKRAVRRMKAFKILRQNLSLELLGQVDDVVRIIAGIVNLSPSIFSDDEFIQQPQCGTSNIPVTPE
ncbi:uncharacterized protein LOC135368133 isoform X1 [Ornithodoros turicata]|uniref:uncharacterized protein LOC135368133 isoform X1 n=1 Tax=Ornithodoros turicata TaxID=34597 RepID=UPI0031386219